MSLGWLSHRVALALLAAFGVSVLVFALIRLIPGDVVTNLIGLEGHPGRKDAAHLDPAGQPAHRARSSG